MVVVGRVGIEVGALAADRDLAQQTRRLELVQRVVNGSKRHPLSRAYGLLVQQLRRYVAVAVGKQQGSERDALTRRPQPSPAQKLRNRIAHSTGSGEHLRQAHTLG